MSRDGREMWTVSARREQGLHRGGSLGARGLCIVDERMQRARHGPTTDLFHLGPDHPGRPGARGDGIGRVRVLVQRRDKGRGEVIRPMSHTSGDGGVDGRIDG